MNKTQWENQHLLWRAGFGPAVQDLEKLQRADSGAIYKALIRESAKPPAYLDVVPNAIKGLMMGIGEADRMNRRELSPDEKKQLRERSREDLKNLNLHWLGEMAASPAQLREKMAFFWHGHFACRNLNIYYQQLLLHQIRTHALGNFGELLRGVSKSAAMLNFLNNNQNRKDHPNENFAREVMELFTMGRGQYREQDVKEAARAFTGWGATLSGEFVLRRMQHDDGQKSFLGRQGNFDGDDIIDILLEQPATARFITTKIYRFFVHEEVDTKRVEVLAKSFYDSGYDISKLLNSIFTSDWFYEEHNMGNRIKSPVELLVGIRRQLPFTMQDESSQLVFQKLLGQILFYPPNVAGWPGGRSWIDSSSLLFRMRLPQVIARDEGISLQPKQDDDIQMGRVFRLQQGSGARIDWDVYQRQFESRQPDSLLPEISRFILQSSEMPDGRLLTKHITTGSQQDYIRTLTLQLMSCPEYQLC